MRSSATKTWLHCYYETKTRANGSVIAEVASPALAAYRLLPRTAAMCSPEDDCMPLHDVVVERGAVDALGRIVCMRLKSRIKRRRAAVAIARGTASRRTSLSPRTSQGGRVRCEQAHDEHHPSTSLPT